MNLKPNLQKMKYYVIVGGLILLLIWLLSGCRPVSDDEQTISESESMAALTQTAAPSPSATHTPTGTSAPPTKTATTTPFATVTYTSTPTASLASTPFPNGYVLFETAFETDAEGLILAGDETGWVIQEDENGNHFLCNMNQSKPILEISIGDEHWKNYQLSLEVKDFEFAYDPDLAIYTAEEIFHIRVRKIEDTAYHFLISFVGYKNLTEGLTPDASQVHFAKTLSTNDGIPILVESLEAPLENLWYPIRIAVNEGAIQFDWNNALVIDYYDEEYLFEGAISFLTNYGTCLDNIRVTNIGDTE